MPPRRGVQASWDAACGRAAEQRECGCQGRAWAAAQHGLVETGSTACTRQQRDSQPRQPGLTPATPGICTREPGICALARAPTSSSGCRRAKAGGRRQAERVATLGGQLDTTQVRLLRCKASLERPARLAWLTQGTPAPPLNGSPASAEPIRAFSRSCVAACVVAGRVRQGVCRADEAGQRRMGGTRGKPAWRPASQGCEARLQPSTHVAAQHPPAPPPAPTCTGICRSSVSSTGPPSTPAPAPPAPIRPPSRPG